MILSKNLLYNPQIKLALQNVHRETSKRLYPAEIGIKYIQLFLLLCSVNITSRGLDPRNSAKLLFFGRP